ncbi:hypothetical protein [Streptomyces sp. BPSDS2]|uniref:hypothetical protein n=1 Tax=Streptomyces sp. BPSDS2 TaxID=2571021 RepID=UPI0010C215E5|nr:hypothetical protein [Streptomyces sp. BPSDS2]
MKKLTATAAMVGVLTLGVGVSPAAAAGNCGYTSSCTDLSSGRLTVFLSSASHIDGRMNIVVSYKKNSGSPINARFGYNMAGSIKWAGRFNQSRNTTKNTTWKDAYVIKTCKSTVGMLDVTGQQTFNTPPATGC